MAQRSYRRSVVRRRRATAVRRRATTARRRRATTVRRRANATGGRSKAGEVAKKLAIAAGSITDPSDFAQFIQPRLLSGKCYPGLLKATYTCCNISSSAGQYPGCNQYLLLTCNPGISFDAADTKYGIAAYRAATSGTAFTSDTSLMADFISNVSVNSTTIRDLNIKAISQQLTYNGQYSQCKGRVWAGNIPNGAVIAGTMSPAMLMVYPGIKEYGMDEILGGLLTVWGSKQSTHANDFVALNGNNDDYNLPVIMIYEAPLDPTWTAGSSTRSTNSIVIQHDISFDYRPNVNTNFQPLVDIKPDTGGVTPDEWNLTSKKLATMPNSTHLSKGINPMKGASWPFNQAGYGSVEAAYLGFTDLTTEIKAWVPGIASWAVDMISGLVSDLGSDPEIASLVYGAIRQDPMAINTLLQRAAVYGGRQGIRAGLGRPGPPRAPGY